MTFIFLILGVMAIIFLGAFLIVPFKMAATEPFICENCGHKMKLITKIGKCYHCKTKYFKNINGKYQVKN